MNQMRSKGMSRNLSKYLQVLFMGSLMDHGAPARGTGSTLGDSSRAAREPASLELIQPSCFAKFDAVMPEPAEWSLTTGIAVGNGGQCRTGFLGKVVTLATKNLQLTGSIDPLSVRIPVSPPFYSCP